MDPEESKTSQPFARSGVTIKEPRIFVRRKKVVARPALEFFSRAFRKWPERKGGDPEA